MARYGISYEDVAQAAQQLIAEGRTPTIETIRAITGTGSSTTIAIHLRAFKDKQNQNKSSPSKDNLPQELLSFIKGLWGNIMNQAETYVETVKNEVAGEISQLKAEVSKLLEENTRWQQDHEVWQQQKASLSSDKSALEQCVITLQKESATLQANLEGANQQSQDRQVHIDELTRLNQQIQSNLEHFREASREQRLLDQAKFENEQRQLMQMIQELKQQAQEQQQIYMQMQNKFEVQRQETVSLNLQYEKSMALCENTKSQLTKVESSLAKSEETRGYWQQQAETTKTKWADLQSKHIMLEQKANTDADRLISMQSELAQLIEQHKYQAREKWELAQEKSMLEGQLKQLQAMFAKA